MEIVELDIEAQRPALGREPFKRRDEPIVIVAREGSSRLDLDVIVLCSGP